MANSINGRPWVLDTQSPSPIPNAPYRTMISGYTWRGYTDPTHRVAVKDAKRNVIVHELTGKADLSPVTVFFPTAAHVIQFTLLQLDSGVLEVDIH